MNLNNLHMVINDDGFLTDKERYLLIKAYFELFSRMYGKDVPTALLEVLKLDENHQLTKKILNLSENYKKALLALKQIMPDINGKYLKLLMIYNNNELVAAARFGSLSEKVGSIPDAVFMVSLEERKILWPKMIKYIENYLKLNGYEKMYIEVPLVDPFLLKGCFDLNFHEDYEDIVKNEGTRTYFLNKTLERKKNE